MTAAAAAARSMTNRAIVSASSSHGVMTTTTATTMGGTMTRSSFPRRPPSSSSSSLYPQSKCMREWSSLAGRHPPRSSSSSFLRIGGGPIDRLRDHDRDDPSMPSMMRHQRQQRRHFARDRGGRRGRLPRGGGGGVGGRRGHDDDDYDGNKDGPRRGGGDDGRTRSHDDDVELGSTRRNSSSRYEERSYLDRDDRVVYRRHGARDDEHDEYDRDGTGGRKNVLVIGSSGVLGRAISSHFARGCKWNVLGADVVGDDDDEKEGGGSLLREYVRLPDGGSLSDLAGALVHGVSAYVRGGEGGMKGRTSSSSSSLLDAVVIASGGWAGDVPFVAHDVYDDEDGAKQAMRNAEICERMIRMNYFPVVAGSLVGPRFVKRGGLFVMIGASAALSPTPGMLGYGSAKSAAHHYLRSLGPGMRESSDITAVGVLPLMLDTPANRAMLDRGGEIEEDGKYSKMVKPMHIANEIGEWIKNPRLRPHSGSLVKVIAKNRRDGSGGAAFHLVR